MGALALFLQGLAPLSGLAQVDPCVPVPIPELCDVDPSPSPSGEPSPGKKKGKPAGGGGGGASTSQEAAKADGTADGGNKAKSEKEEAAPAPPVAAGPLVVSAPNNTADLIGALSVLSRFGVDLQQSVMTVTPPFPVAGLAYWSDDWHACRDGCSRLHQGLDIFAQAGTPLVSSADGFVSQKVVGELSGISIEITDDAGVQYFYAHMSAWAPGIQVGDRVTTGQLLGYVGNTGNAISTPPHLHFEYQPGGIPAPPKPHVDQWVELAELKAQQLVAKYTGRPLPQASDFRVTRLFDLSGGGEAPDTGAERLLALAGLQPSVSSLEMARQLLGQMALEIDWGGLADAQLAQLAQQHAALMAAQDLSSATPWAPFGVAAQPATASTGSLEQGD
ncbi:MAG TPA: M23 family metallopeptidase [Actinomycetota bacterium]|nr:M23 family metallopeptidase [Actinomycetota bacterium]